MKNPANFICCDRLRMPSVAGQKKNSPRRFSISLLLSAKKMTNVSLFCYRVFAGTKDLTVSAFNSLLRIRFSIGGLKVEKRRT